MTGQAASSRGTAYFAALYDADPDPWNFIGSAYEQEKYLATLAALEGRHFGNAFEIGCSIGVFTRMLVPRCGGLLAIDIVEAALAAAKRRCADMPQVSFANMLVPAQWPEGQKFDLILVSEMLYFLTPTDITSLAGLAAASLSQEGVILLVNYTEQINEPCSGDQAAEIFIAAAKTKLLPAYQQRFEKFRIDRLQAREDLRGRPT
jgi:predicted TPR repeat methyltransferase